MLSPLEIGVVGLLAVLLFGTRRLPELGSGLGQAISNFKKAYKDGMTIDVTPSQTKENDTTSTEEPKK